MGHCV